MSNLYDVYSIKKVFLPYIFYGKALVIFSLLALFFALDLNLFLEEHEHRTDQVQWLLYASYAFLGFTIFIGSLLFKAAIYCVFKVMELIKNNKKKNQGIIHQTEKKIFIYLYIGAFSFAFGVSAMALYVLMNW